MKKHIMSFIALAVASTSAFAKAPFELNIKPDPNVPEYQTLIVVDYIYVDGVKITDIIVNRGKCSTKRVFGSHFVVGCGIRRIYELEVKTNEGKTYSFSARR